MTARKRDWLGVLLAWAALALIVLMLVMAGCAPTYVHTRAADGTETTVWTMPVLTDRVVRDFKATAGPTTRSVEFNSESKNAAAAELLKAAVELAK